MGKKYNDKQLTLWARMIVNQQHSDMETPPNIPGNHRRTAS